MCRRYIAAEWSAYIGPRDGMTEGFPSDRERRLSLVRFFSPICSVEDLRSDVVIHFQKEFLGSLDGIQEIHQTTNFGRNNLNRAS